MPLVCERDSGRDMSCGGNDRRARRGRESRMMDLASCTSAGFGRQEEGTAGCGPGVLVPASQVEAAPGRNRAQVHALTRPHTDTAAESSEAGSAKS